MSTDGTAAHHEHDDPRGEDDGTVRERCEQERNTTTPTPEEARARAADDHEDGEEAEPPAADTQAP
ncbi:hypothetical protein ACFVSN_35975 [Kitasatospora sp. NPDC057904]|uniref:hypothetical protein n=1 Tax=unclassified Kitasatospora TaxID=2633591 RepID=UPI0036DC17B0